MISFPCIRVASAYLAGANSVNPVTMLNVEVRPRKYFRYYEGAEKQECTQDRRVDLLCELAMALPKVEKARCPACDKELVINYPLDPSGESYDCRAQFPSRLCRRYVLDGTDTCSYEQAFYCSDECMFWPYMGDDCIIPVEGVESVEIRLPRFDPVIPPSLPNQFDNYLPWDAEPEEIDDYQQSEWTTISRRRRKVATH
jgi:hypothetical protein